MSNLTTIERDLAALHQLLCRAMVEWRPIEPDDKSHTAEEWSRDATARQEIYAAMREVFERYPGVLYHDFPRPPNPIAADWKTWTDEQRLEFIAELPCCRHCGSLNTRCQCWNDE
jgi:hypothetical protein